MSSDTKQSFEDFYRQEYRALYRFIYSIILNVEDAWDLTQDSFCKLSESCDSEDKANYTRALLFTIARNKCYDFLRRRKTHDICFQIESNILPFKHNDENPEKLLLDKENESMAIIAFESLNDREKICLRMRRSGYTYRDIAEKMSMNPPSVRQLTRRALKRFGEFYKHQQKQEINHGKAAKTNRS